MRMLLETGADPNLKVYSNELEQTANSQLRPVLVEYLASNEKPTAQVVSLLLRYGARVVMKTQFRDPDGILNSLHNLDGDSSSSVFFLLLEASESFDPCMIRRNSVISEEQRRALLDLSSCPLTLRRQMRLYLRRRLRILLPKQVQALELPHSLHKYLLFDYS